VSRRFLRAISCPPRIIAAVPPLVPIVAGLVALATGVLILRSFGPNYRIGRLLASTPEVTIAEARALALGSPRYVRVSGRIDSETDFEDQHHRPLVFRRTRLELRSGKAWSTFDDHRERVPFEVRDGLDAIAVDDAALDAGLVVIPRESVGTAADAPDRVPAGTPPGTPLRLRIDQVSSVEHAIVLGVPGTGEDGQPVISAGRGRPLILTTLEPDEAMRVLAHGDTRRPLAAMACIAGGLTLITIGAVLAVVAVVA
jgi:hypothetical protein